MGMTSYDSRGYRAITRIGPASSVICQCLSLHFHLGSPYDCKAHSLMKNHLLLLGFIYVLLGRASFSFFPTTKLLLVRFVKQKANNRCVVIHQSKAFTWLSIKTIHTHSGD